MTERITELPITERAEATGRELPLGTMFTLDLPSGMRRTYVILGRMARKFEAGSHVCAELSIPDNGSIDIGVMQPLPDRMRPTVIGSLQGDAVMHSVEQQFGDFGTTMLQWLGGAAVDPWANTNFTEH